MSQDRTRKLQDKTSHVLKEVQSQGARQQSVVEILKRTTETMEVSGDVEQARRRMNVEKARLRDVIGEKQELQTTIGTLIAGYDALTNALGGSIDSMKEMTRFEKFVGMFSGLKARRMREARIQAADITVQLKDLVSQTTGINKMLSDHLKTLDGEYVTVRAMLEEQQVKLKAATETFEAADKRLEELNMRINDQRDSSAEFTGLERVDADKVLQGLINEANDLTEVRNSALAAGQTHELFAENHKIALDSLLRQKAAQRVLIDKLRISTENRIVQYAATVESLRTATQQESAHMIDEVGVTIDQETTRTMAAIGAAADRQIVEMLERHAEDIGKRRATQSDVARADAEFARRFADAARLFLEDGYEEVA